MKNVSYVTHGMMAIAVVFSGLFFASCKDGATGTTNGTTATGSGEFSGATLPIAYINMDSVLTNYEFSKDINERLIKKREDMAVTVNQKGKRLEKDAAEFERKRQNGAFFSQERAEQEYNRLMQQQQELEALGQRLQGELVMEQQKENLKLADSIRNIVKLYNVTAKYELVLNMNELENIILANPKYDITNDILQLLNSRYTPDAKK